MATSATLSADCPTCGQPVEVTVELALAPLVVDGRNTVIPTTGMTSAAHYCPDDEQAVPAGE